MVYKNNPGNLEIHLNFLLYLLYLYTNDKHYEKVERTIFITGNFTGRTVG
jgi:preprotein translocase subunit SecA